MKKSTVLLILICCIFFTACEKEKNEWTIDDFSLYELDGTLYNYPDNETLSLDYYEEEHKNYQTKRGVKLFSPAKTSLSKYDFTGFYCAVSRYPILGSNTEKEDKVEKDYFEKYPDINERIKHTQELEKSETSLYVSADFAVKNDKLIQLETNEKGYPIEKNWRHYEVFSISFTIKNDEVISITLQNQKP